MYWHIDGGTTNTRLYRQDSTGVRLAAAAPVGAGNPAGLTGFVRGALAQFVRAGDTVLASGMIEQQNVDVSPEGALVFRYRLTDYGRERLVYLPDAWKGGRA